MEQSYSLLLYRFRAFKFNFRPSYDGRFFVSNINVGVLELTHRQRIQGNEVSAIGERKDGAETVNNLNIT